MLVVGVLIIALLLVFKLDLSSFASAISHQISLRFYVLISLTITLQLVCRALRFHLLFNRIQNDHFSLKNSFLLTGASYFVAMATPNKLGDTSRGLFFREKGTEVTAITIIEFLFDLLAIVGIALVGTLAVYRSYLPIPLAAIGVLAIGVVGLYFLVKRDALTRLAGRFSRLQRPVETVRECTVYIKAGLRSKFVVIAGMFFTVLFHAIYFVVFYALLGQLAVGVAFTEVLFAAGVGMLVGGLTFVPMGVGTRDASTYGLLCSVGVHPDAAMVSVIVMRSLTVWLILGSAICYFATIRKLSKS